MERAKSNTMRGATVLSILLWALPAKKPINTPLKTFVPRRAYEDKSAIIPQKTPVQIPAERPKYKPAQITVVKKKFIVLLPNLKCPEKKT